MALIREAIVSKLEKPVIWDLKMLQTCVIRPAVPTDIATILDLLDLKANFDGCPGAVQATAEQLHRDLFGEPCLASVLLAEVGQDVAGFATYHRIYSTFLAKPGIWLDDLYLKPEFRGRGMGKALMQHLCQIASDTGCGRIDWTVAVDNAIGIQFYRHMGATINEAVRLCRLEDTAITQNL